MYCLQTLCPGHDITEEYRPGIGLDLSTRQLTVDLYIRDLNLGLEYQGFHHYFDNPEAFGPAMMQEARDAEKDYLCQTSGA